MQNNIYAGNENVNLVRTYAPNRFSHASTIAPLKRGTIVAFYSGKAECHDSQRIWIFYNDKDGKTYDPIYLENLTGNPVFLTHQDGVKIIYSRFEDLVPKRFEWWQHCSTWVRDIDFQDGEIKVSGGVPLQVPGTNDFEQLEIGYLPRCNPIAVSDGYLLPLYREQHPKFYGAILHSHDGVQWSLRGTIGNDTSSDQPCTQPCIQPTIWYQDGKVHALLRNFTRYGKRMALYSASEDNGKTWSDPVNSTFYNANNSILVIDCPPKDNRRKTVLVVWNNDPHGRENITLGVIKNEKLHFNIIAKLDNYGSYPAACVGGDKLHITWTTQADKLKFPYAKSVIRHVEYDLDSVVRHISSN